MILSDENSFEVDYATSVSEALKKMEQQNYAVVVSDYEMPVKNGLDFLRELREQRDDIPFILFTGRGREEVVVKALNLGAECYINKNGSPQTVYCELADAITTTVERKKSKQLLIESDIKYRTLVEKSLQGILITQTSPLRLVFANSAMGNMLGFSVEELKSLSPLGVAGLIHDDDKVIFFNRLIGRIHGVQAKSSLEFKAIRKDGSIVWLEVFSNRIEYMGEPAIQGIFLDITERRKAQENLLESEERYRELANSLPDIVFEADADGKVVFVNDKGFEIAGISHEDLEKGLNALEFLAPDDRKRAMKNIQRLLANSSNIYDEYKILKKDGSTFPIIVTATPRKSKNAITGFRALAIDISERKKTEETLKESEEKFRNLAEESPNMIFINCRGKVVYANKKCEDKLGIGRAEFYSSNFSFLSLIASEDVELLKSSFAKHMRGEAVPSYEYTLVARSGTRINAIITTKLIDYNGERAVMGIVTDITERKKAEDALRKSEEKFKQLAEVFPETIFEANMKGDITYANEHGLKQFGFTQEEIVSGINIFDLVSPLDRNLAMERIQTRIKDSDKSDKRYLEYKAMKKDGSTFYAMALSVPIMVDGVPAGIRGFILDITEHKQAENMLYESEERYRLIAENTADTIAVFDLNLNPTYLSPSILKLRGYTVKEVMTQTLNQMLTPDSLQQASKKFADQMALELSGTADPTRTILMELEEYCKDGSTVFVELAASYLRDENFKPNGILTVTRDITERKNAEEKLRQTLESLRKAVVTTVQVLVSAVESRDSYTAGHQSRSANLACAIAIEMGLSQEKIDGIRMAGIIHDIGKLSIPAEILSKPTKLKEIEFSLIKEHSRSGYEMLKNVESPWPLAEIVYQHHERLNGAGYPRNLKGDEILMESRILAVADVVEAMASHRPYRPTLGIEAALEEIEKNKGILYDDTVADTCLKLFREKGYQLT